jgi:hypothetical protein
MGVFDVFTVIPGKRVLNLPILIRITHSTGVDFLGERYLEVTFPSFQNAKISLTAWLTW